MNPTDCPVLLATYSVLLTVGLHVLAASITPDPDDNTLIIRTRRHDGRGMTLSGFFPNGGMTAYASSGDWGHLYRGYGNHRPIHYPQQGWSNPSQSTSQTTNTDTGGSPEAEESTSWKDENQNSSGVSTNKEEQPYPAVTKKPKKKPVHHKESSSEENDDDDVSSHGHSGGNAKASFNAWFPIMLGMFPPSQDDSYGYSGSSRKSQPQTSIVANSVSHGPGGVASSHAVAYLGQPEYRSQQH